MELPTRADSILVMWMCAAVGAVRALPSDGLNVTSRSTAPATGLGIDVLRRSHLVDEAFHEQKDVLLEMLEAKLKEVRDKKKQTCEPASGAGAAGLVMRSRGVGAVGSLELALQPGPRGNGTLVLDSTGISNVGRAHVQLDIQEGSLRIPGLQNLFSG
ncbi:uncharacterized protein LOC126978600 isoform X2 [Leptidea sinapis]|nr:uncharacterized protein LOC126978600 isoform X2 [Leptidea sinapis]